MWKMAIGAFPKSRGVFSPFPRSTMLVTLRKLIYMINEALHIPHNSSWNYMTKV